jgi:6-pyruvoyltetrahydropterin/6-carboxytetrahydropterin synthase
MSKWNIGKQFDFCYGHRVWSQELNTEFSLDDKLKCRHIHGHQGKLIVFLESSNLKDGMVTDFKHLNWFKKWVDDVLDHKMIMDINDPLLPFEIPHIHNEWIVDYYRLKYNYKSSTKFYTIEESVYSDLPTCLQEKYEGMVLVDFIPTSENLSKWLLDIVQEKMEKINIKVSQVVFFETPKSQSIYSA